jgi:(p)ppGpp synthase/HD superfamily hydrolase
MEQILEIIRDFADRAHGEQLRKYSPDRYIVHPIRVMRLCKTVTNDLPTLACALLHDVLEDTKLTDQDIYNFLQPLLGNTAAGKTIALVVELTDVYIKSNYPGLNRRERKASEARRMKSVSAQAQTVKYADILDNCLEIVRHDNDFAPVFLKECRQLLEVMEKGNASLRSAAIKVVESELKRLKN